MLHRYSFLNRSLLAYATLLMYHHTYMQRLLQEPAQKAPLLDLLATLAESADISANQMLKVRFGARLPSRSPALLHAAMQRHGAPACDLGGQVGEMQQQPSNAPYRCLPLQGFQRVADNLADTALDNPRAKDEFPTIVESAQRAGWLESNFEARCRQLAPQCGCQLEGQHEEGCGLRLMQSLPCQPAARRAQCKEMSRRIPAVPSAGASCGLIGGGGRRLRQRGGVQGGRARDDRRVLCQRGGRGGGAAAGGAGRAGAGQHVPEAGVIYRCGCLLNHHGSLHSASWEHHRRPWGEPALANIFLKQVWEQVRSRWAVRTACARHTTCAMCTDAIGNLARRCQRWPTCS